VTTPLHRFARWYFRERFTALFLVLLVAIGGHSLVGRLLPVANPLDWLLGLSLVAVVFSVREGRLRFVLYALTAGFVVARLAQPLLDHPAPLFVSQSAMAVACLLAAGVAVRRALATGPVDREHIFAALDAYLLVGLAFGVGYWLLEAAQPGSFAPGPGGAFTPQRAIYFSFVTQATLGYGDVLPLRDEAQGIAIVQAVGGQMYLAVLVARLVSLFSARTNS
jgi:hypothetical protein